MSTLSPRQQSIFYRVVDTHIETGLPVGSTSITRLYRELYQGTYSSATIRNEMGMMEQMGYLTHPHTSAGRVPTDRGYRYYVDHVSDFGPSEVPVPRVKSPSFETDQDTDLWGESVCEDLSEQSEEVAILILPVLLSKQRRLKLYFRGSSRMLEKPEFQNIEKFRMLLQALEEKREFIEWMTRFNAEQEGVSVSIGQENGKQAFSDCAVVSSVFEIAPHRKGILAILGPRRMRYTKTIPLVDQTASIVKRNLIRRGASIL